MLDQENVASQRPYSEADESVNSSSLNGLILSNLNIPEEVIAIILSFLPWNDLLPCRLVCKTWKEIVESSVRRKKMKELQIKNLVSSHISCDYTSALKFGNIPFFVNYAIGTKFGKNLLKNRFGNVNNNNFEHWKIISSGGDGWAVEEVPHGSDLLPEALEGSSCFVTSYRWGYKHQLINLKHFGLNSKIMDEIQPDIKVSEWYAGRFDCGSRYKIHVRLLDDRHQLIAEFKDEKRIELIEACTWYEVTHTFSDYGQGVRYVLFGHGGCDTQFWKGHYGSKMAGGEVTALIPERILKEITESS